jgi:translocator protein
MKRVNVRTLVLCLFIVYLIAFIGSLFVSNTINSPWYSSIKTPITPPNWVFPVVWNILFLFIASSLYLSWTANTKTKKESKKNRIKIAIIFGINLLLNIFWSYLFFTLQSPLFSFYELIAFEVSIFVMIVITYRIRKSAGLILIPYALWIIFAGILNYIIAFH